MKGVVVKEIGASASVVDDLPLPEPNESQVLVKSLFTAINPVDAFMASSGIMVLRWPFVLGCDAAGVVVKTGAKAEGPLGPLKVGDQVLGCTRLGDGPYATAQEHFLMDAALATPKPDNISTAEASTVGVGFYTACLGVFGGLNIPFPDDVKSLPPATGEWTLVLGGSSSVGKFAVQLLKALGYKVLASCSAKSSELLKSLGATETLDYKKSEGELLEVLTKITDGKLTRIFDAVASNHDLAKAFYKNVEGEKYFTTTNGWTPMTSAEFNGANVDIIQLGAIGYANADKVNGAITQQIPLMYQLLSTGAAKPAEYEIIGEPGFESVIEAYAYQQTGKAGAKKVIVKLQDA